MSFFKRPDNSVLPTTILGLFFGGQIRYESPQGGDCYAGQDEFVFMEPPVFIPKEGKYWAITHNQRKLRFMFLSQWPLCCHLQWTLKKQTPGKPGSEIAFTLRLGAWRWDPEGTNGLNWMGFFTGFIGFHYD